MWINAGPVKFFKMLFLSFRFTIVSLLNKLTATATLLRKRQLKMNWLSRKILHEARYRESVLTQKETIEKNLILLNFYIFFPTD